jgi:hypothetical protein
MLVQKAAHRSIERSHPDRMPPGAPGCVGEVVLEPVGRLDGKRVLQQRSTNARRGGAPAQSGDGGTAGAGPDLVLLLVTAAVTATPVLPESPEV